MKYVSTRGERKVDFVEAMSQGLAEGGGLYQPVDFPDLSYLLNNTYSDFAAFAVDFLTPFLAGSVLVDEVESLTKAALNFPLKTTQLTEQLQVLELFHGPTLSFKDFGARFLAQCLSRLNQSQCILVATSGDTGSAVASSFSGLSNLTAVVLFPKGKITARQKAQITCWHKNILAVEVEGFFDDCQALVKAAFADVDFKQQVHLSTANSINIARILPQMSYYAYCASQYYTTHQAPLNFVVPSGNLGNVTACFYAKQLGFPIGNITIACNANRAVVDYLQTGDYHSKATIRTLANAMDVGAPSNFERLQSLWLQYPDLQTQVSCGSVSDADIQQAIIDGYQRYDYLMCPHTAVGYHLAQQTPTEHTCLVSTAHPAKFETVIEPLIKQSLLVPDALQALLVKPQNFTSISSELTVLKPLIIAHCKG